MSLFQAGETIETISALPIKIIRYIAGGGQGDVYEVEYKGKRKALKWYKSFGKNKKEFYENLKENVQKGSPDHNFLWPEAVTKERNGSFGYVMELRPKEFHELSEFIIARDVKFPSFKACVKACLQIASAFRILHNKGYSYQDINDGNFFINPNTGDVLICDNDNVAPNGRNMGVIGKPRYMAPEIVSNHVLPNTQTDRFSLSIILFVLLCNNHPLEGSLWAKIPCMTAEFAEKIYGLDAVFIYDQNNRSNAPIEKLQPNVVQRWAFMPSYVKEAFLKSFSKEAITKPSSRLRESDWLKVLTRFQSEIVKCSCGNEIFIENASDTKCDNCGKVYHVEHKLKLPNYSVTIARGTWVYRCQLGTCNDTEALDPLLRTVFATNKQGKQVVCLQNKTGKAIKAITSSGKQKSVNPDELIPVIAGVKVELYGSEIEII